MIYESTRVRLPDGSEKRARLGGLTGTGHRRAYIRVTDPYVGRVTVAGRVSTTDKKRARTFEVSVDGLNSTSVLSGHGTFAA